MNLCNHELSVVWCHHHPCIVVIITVCGQSSQPQVWSQKLYILCIYAHMPLVYAHELISEYNLCFLNDIHFSSFLFVDLLTIWLSLELSYLAQLCICTRVKLRRNYAAVDNFLKLLILKLFHILHFPPFTMCFEIHITINSFWIACIYALFKW